MRVLKFSQFDLKPQTKEVRKRAGYDILIIKTNQNQSQKTQSSEVESTSGPTKRMKQAKDAVPKSQVPQLGHPEPNSGACRSTSARHERPAGKDGLRGTAWADGAARGARMRTGPAHAQRVAFRPADRPAGKITS